MSTEIDLPVSNLQTEFAFALAKLRNTLVQDALLETVSVIDIAALDQDLARYLKAVDLKALARVGLRGELAFATPFLLDVNPYLLGYYGCCSE